MMKRLVFMRKVTELKAWELYVGQSLFFVLVAIFFFIIRRLLDMTPLGSDTRVIAGLTLGKSIGTGDVNGSIETFADKVGIQQQ